MVGANKQNPDGAIPVAGATLMTQRLSSDARVIVQPRVWILMILGLIPILLFAGARSMGAAESPAPDRCVACHTDAATLKALTPPDPPASEAGEG